MRRSRPDRHLCLFAVLWFACVRICDPYLGCQAPSAHAATISRTAASIVYEFYVFMAVSLTGLSLVFQPVLFKLGTNRINQSFGDWRG